VVVTAVDRRRTFDVSRADARPWLYGIVSNLVARHVRAETRRYRALAKAHVAEPGGHHGDADDIAGRLDAAAVRGRLATALRKLPEPVRAVPLLVAWAGLNQQEAADELGIPPRRHRTRQEMRQALEADQ
jgi:RNA polymerase sigma factor (sigma-70 family)